MSCDNSNIFLYRCETIVVLLVVSAFAVVCCVLFVCVCSCCYHTRYKQFRASAPTGLKVGGAPPGDRRVAYCAAAPHHAEKTRTLSAYVLIQCFACLFVYLLLLCIGYTVLQWYNSVSAFN